ncbi:hypothetical protein SELMODRAFT_106437 [Selaginella moellendorffii]|uniref:Pentacotripeptide-repeat region of PRORP domain-containing protein n=2 Tax=Selaginella moellendorffii TaxID=88036 RepID=D8S193_SELML|nr:hypothetical protein SELMODRAFT_106437 [Selaginella moellendorffii]
MALEGFRPDEITLLSVLAARGHAGEQGLREFGLAIAAHGLAHSKNHYSCIINALARAGRIRDAEELIAAMPFAPDAETWAALLGAPNYHESLEKAAMAAKNAMEAESPLTRGLSAPYVMLSNLCCYES